MHISARILSVGAATCASIGLHCVPIGNWLHWFPYVSIAMAALVSHQAPSHRKLALALINSIIPARP